MISTEKNCLNASYLTKRPERTRSCSPGLLFANTLANGEEPKAQPWSVQCSSPTTPLPLPISPVSQMSAPATTITMPSSPQKASNSVPKNVVKQKTGLSLPPCLTPAQNIRCVVAARNASECSKSITHTDACVTPSKNEIERRENLIHTDASVVIIKKGPAVQTGIDRYYKRKLTPPHPKAMNLSKIPKTNSDMQPELGQNRFSILAVEEISESKPKAQKPPPIYLREQNSNSLIKVISQYIGATSFHVMSIQKGKIPETKIQIYNEANYRKIIDLFDKSKKSYYTYQLKSSKGLSVVLKGIEPFVESGEVKDALNEAGFLVKSVFNIQNRNKVPLSLFRVELEFDPKTLSKGESHPIYSLRYLLNRKITVEEPHKRRGPIQCRNCQEFGHSKTYCTLSSVCVICGDLHHTNLCQKVKEDANAKKCSNCGGNHTANYRGCPVYQTFKTKALPKVATTSLGIKIPSLPVLPSRPIVANPVRLQNVSYANALKGIPQEPAVTQDAPQSSTLEQTLQMFIQNMSHFMASMQNMMQDMIKNQTLLLQTLLAKP